MITQSSIFNHKIIFICISRRELINGLLNEIIKFIFSYLDLSWHRKIGRKLTRKWKITNFSAVAQNIFFTHFWRLHNLVKVKYNSDIRSQGREKYDKNLAILLLHVFPFFHSLTFHWHPSVLLDFHLFLKICFLHDILNFWNILLTAIIVLMISGFEFFLRFFP